MLARTFSFRSTQSSGLTALSIPGFGINPSSSTSSSSKTVTFNGLSGETLIAVVGVWASGRNTPLPTNWTDVLSGEVASTVDANGKLRIMRRELSSSLATQDFTITGGATSSWAAAVIRIGGDVAATPLDATPVVTLDQAANTAPICPNFTTVTDNALALRIFSRFSGQLTAADDNEPSGTTIVFAQPADGAASGRCAIGAAWHLKASAGALGTATWTGLGTSSRVCIPATIAIRPGA